MKEIGTKRIRKKLEPKNMKETGNQRM